MEIREIIDYGGKLMFIIKSEDGRVRLTEAIITGETVTKPLNPTPWLVPGEPPEKLDIWDLYMGVYNFIHEHADLMRKGYYHVFSTWTLASWLQEALPIAVYLNLLGRKETGKTKVCVDLLREIAYRGIPSTVITGPALFRTIQEYKPTLLIDESEFITKKKQDLVAVINAGYRRGVKVIRIEERGKKREPETYEVFGFKAMGGTEELNEITASRTVLIKMHRLRRPLRMFVDQKKGKDLRSSLLRFRLDHLDAFKNFVEPKLETEMIKPGKESSPRVLEIFFPLLSLIEYLAQSDGRFRDVKKSIEEVMKELSRERSAEEKAGEDAKLVETLLCMRPVEKIDAAEWMVSVASVVEEYNKDLPEKSDDRITKQKAGVMLSRMGFDKVTVEGRKSGYRITEDLMKELSSDYGIPFLTQQEKVQLVLQAVGQLRDVQGVASKVRVQDHLKDQVDRAETLRIIDQLIKEGKLSQVGVEHVKWFSTTQTPPEETANGKPEGGWEWEGFHCTGRFSTPEKAYKKTVQVILEFQRMEGLSVLTNEELENALSYYWTEDSFGVVKSRLFRDGVLKPTDEGFEILGRDFGGD